MYKRQPQNVIGSLVADPLERAGLLMTDIDKYSPEMQNPDITKPAGAGDVPEANYKMIAALAVKKGQIARTEKPAMASSRIGRPFFTWSLPFIPSFAVRCV